MIRLNAVGAQFFRRGGQGRTSAMGLVLENSSSSRSSLSVLTRRPAGAASPPGHPEKRPPFQPQIPAGHPGCSRNINRRDSLAPGCRNTRESFVVLHYHFRAGGVRRVIELLLPYLAEYFRIHRPSRRERPDAEWERAGLAAEAPSARFAACKSLNYLEPGFIPVAAQRTNPPRAEAPHQSETRWYGHTIWLWVGIFFFRMRWRRAPHRPVPAC